MDWFLYDRGLRHERVNIMKIKSILHVPEIKGVWNSQITLKLSQRFPDVFGGGGGTRVKVNTTNTRLTINVGDVNVNSEYKQHFNLLKLSCSKYVYLVRNNVIINT